MQINSETDFVARNDQFMSLVRGAAAAALSVPVANGAPPRERCGRLSIYHTHTHTRVLHVQPPDALLLWPDTTTPPRP
jgi:hypothetical protein